MWTDVPYNKFYENGKDLYSSTKDGGFEMWKTMDVTLNRIELIHNWWIKQWTTWNTLLFIP